MWPSTEGNEWHVIRERKGGHSFSKATELWTTAQCSVKERKCDTPGEHTQTTCRSEVVVSCTVTDVIQAEEQSWGKYYSTKLLKYWTFSKSSDCKRITVCDWWFCRERSSRRNFRPSQTLSERF